MSFDFFLEFFSQWPKNKPGLVIWYFEVYIGRRSVSHRPWYTGLARKSEIPNCYLFVTHCCSTLDVINHTVPSAALLSPQAGFYM